MAIKLLLSEIEFLCALMLPLSRARFGRMSEAEIIEAIERSKWLGHESLLSVASRSDSRVANRVHRVVSHRESRKNPIRRGLIEWHPETVSFSITSKGLQFLEKVTKNLGSEQPDDFTVIGHWLKELHKRTR
ncbi:hypothetical protein [Novosphingobium sp.]|uniref:hypothetical protein n=1 Tax=Novosphingobium sp. TaxID=1874826 RepID=UPI002600BE0B|nr:hypothetical protein [Novosphingobium sp.]